MPDAADLWWIISIACVVWFSTVTAYVAVRGAIDIRHMLERLKRAHAAEQAARDESSSRDE